MPGVTTRNPRVKFLLLGRLTALIVCQAMSIAMTVVLPAPVASLRASRASPGLYCSVVASSRSRISRSPRPSRGATSVSQMTVSAASTWQKNGADATELVEAPVLQQPNRLGGHMPIGRVGQPPPAVDMPPKHINGRRRIVLLLFGRETLALRRGSASAAASGPAASWAWGSG